MATLPEALNRLAKWRAVFAGWQLGTRLAGDPECQAVRDHREATLLVRAEVTTVVRLLIAKGVCTREEFDATLIEEASFLGRALELRFPGFRASDIGMELTMPQAAETTKGWRR